MRMIVLLSLIHILSKTKGKIFSALIAVFVVGLILYEGYIWSSGQVKTEKATSIHIDSTYHASGIVIRDETAVTGVSGGALDFIVADGEKVAKNTIIATVYENEEAASLQAQIQSPVSYIHLIWPRLNKSSGKRPGLKISRSNTTRSSATTSK